MPQLHKLKPDLAKAMVQPASSNALPNPLKTALAGQSFAAQERLLKPSGSASRTIDNGSYQEGAPAPVPTDELGAPAPTAETFGEQVAPDQLATLAVAMQQQQAQQSAPTSPALNTDALAAIQGASTGMYEETVATGEVQEGALDDFSAASPTQAQLATLATTAQPKATTAPAPKPKDNNVAQQAPRPKPLTQPKPLGQPKAPAGQALKLPPALTSALKNLLPTAAPHAVKPSKAGPTKRT